MTILITGASGGIGSAIIDHLSRSAVEIIATDINKEALDELASKYQNVKTYVCDLTSTSAVETLSEYCASQDVDTIIHSAGYGGPFLPIPEFTHTEWQKVFKVNVESLFVLLQGILPMWRAKKYGRLVAISSIQGILGSPGSSAYVSSKHALNGLIKTVTAENAEHGISANVICPGYIETPMGADDRKLDDYTHKVLRRTPARAVGTSEEVARLVAFLISPSIVYMNGSIITLDGGITADVGVLQ